MNNDITKTKAFETILTATVEAVSEMLIQPLLLGIQGLVEVTCSDERLKKTLAAGWRKQADSCPDEILGRYYLEWLADAISSPEPPDSADLEKSLRASLRTSLRLIQSRNDQSCP